MKPWLPFEGAHFTRRRAAALCSGVMVLAGAGLFLPASALAATHTVVIEAMSFSPEVVEVNVGDTVTWVNKDPFPHTATTTATATAQDHGFDSGDIPTDQSWTLEVSSEGTFAYVCTLHPTMKGSLVVKPK